MGALGGHPASPEEVSIYLFICWVGIKGKWWVMREVPAMARQRKCCLGALPAPRCPMLTPGLSLRLQPSLVQPWQRPTRRGSSIVSAVCVSVSASARPAWGGHDPPPHILPGRGRRRSLQVWVGKFLRPAAGALGRSPSNGCEAAPPRGGRCCCRHRSCNTSSGRQTTGCCRCSRYPAREGGGGHISGAL